MLETTNISCSEAVTVHMGGKRMRMVCFTASSTTTSVCRQTDADHPK